jgi:hypothetical protein
MYMYMNNLSLYFDDFGSWKKKLEDTQTQC